VNKQALRIKLEAIRQARRIHGGVWQHCIAILGVKLARLPLPTKRLRLRLYRNVYGKKYPPGLDENEAERPLSSYRSLNALFTRGIKPEFRPMPLGTPQFLCPCDGSVQDTGVIERGRLLTLKGIEYSLESLLPQVDPRPFEGGNFMVVFLSPIHCHRVFCPQDGHLEKAVHVPGSRLLVHPPFQRAEFPVYTLNERMILQFSTAFGPSLVVMVAGWGVGNITLPSAPDFRPRSRKVESRTYSQPLPVKKGDWIATFELGSTVVLLMPPGANVTSLVVPNQEVRYGQPVLTYAS
jgi:phosphatidylserine decarboxylase